MPAKTIPLSVRLSEEDADFLAAFKIDDAATPSDKIRAIISQARQLEKGTREYKDSLGLLKNIINPTQKSLLDSERKLNLHSDLISKFSEWTTEALAYFITSLPPEEKKITRDILEEIETGIAVRVLSLMEHILRMSVTENSPCYNTKVLTSRLDPILELINIIQLYRKSLKEN